MTEEPENVDVSTGDELPAYFDALTGLLNQVQLNDETKETILRNYRVRPQEFETSAWRMMNYLTALGVRDNVARYLASRFWSITKNMEDADTKMMRMMMMMKMMNQPAQTSQDPMQQMMQMMMMGGGRMGVAQEPMYGANGQPVVDSSGNQVMRFTMMPSMQQQPSMQGPDPSLELFKEIIKGQNEQKRAADDRYYRTLEKQREIEGEIAEKESRALRRRLASVEQERSSDRLIEDVEKLRKLGLFATGGGGTAANIEAIKLQTDLDKWKFERETDLSRWQQQTDLEARKWYKERELEELRENRTQERLGILGDSLKDTLQTVVTPILTSMSSGVASNFQAQAQAQAASADLPDLTNVSDQDLVTQYQDVQNIDTRAEQAKSLLKAEMERRMQSRGVEVPQAAPVPMTITPEQPYSVVSEEPKIDFGPMADLQFNTPSAVNTTVEDEGYEHSEELVETIDDETPEDYSIEY
jgi:hypothetical protein